MRALLPRYRAGRRARLQSTEVLPSSVPPPPKPDRNKLSLVLWAVSVAKPGPGPHVSPSLSTESGGGWAFQAALGKGRNLFLFTCFFTATCSAHFLLLWAELCTLFLTIVP